MASCMAAADPDADSPGAMASRWARHSSGHQGAAGTTVFHVGRDGAGGSGGAGGGVTAACSSPVLLWGVDSTDTGVIAPYGTIVMPGGGGGSVMLPPSATAPTLALVCFTLADTNRKNALKASGDMSCIWITISVTCLSTSTSA